jgi:glycerophosphoryl diester phosphodiesterase
VWVVAHRGASGHAPENTLAAFRRAVELGANFIETDLHLSRDARFVAIHDPTLDRTTNGRGPVHTLTLAELRKLDAGSWFGPKFSGERIPTLEEILDFARESDVVFYLEIKAGGMWGMEPALVGALRDAREVGRAVVLSFDPGTLAAIRRLEPTLMTGFLFDHSYPDVVGRAVDVGARQLAPRGDLVTPELVAQAHGADLQVVTWTINQAEHIRAMIAAGVDGIMSDYPDRLVAALREGSSGSRQGGR